MPSSPLRSILSPLEGGKPPSSLLSRDSREEHAEALQLLENAAAVVELQDQVAALERRQAELQSSVRQVRPVLCVTAADAQGQAHAI